MISSMPVTESATPDGVCGKKSLVVVLVPVEDEIHSGVEQDLPQTLNFRSRPVKITGAEERPVKVRQRARLAVLFQILDQPLFLRFYRLPDKTVTGSTSISLLSEIACQSPMS